MSGHLRYRIEARKSIYDVERNKVIATFAEPEDADAYLKTLRKGEDNAMLRAEKILRPYLTTAAVWGITPSHEFRLGIDMLPLRLREDIAKALSND